MNFLSHLFTGTRKRLHVGSGDNGSFFRTTILLIDVIGGANVGTTVTAASALAILDARHPLRFDLIFLPLPTPRVLRPTPGAHRPLDRSPLLSVL